MPINTGYICSHKNYFKTKIDMTTPPRIYIEVPVTYGEMNQVLAKLGYHQEFDGKHNRYVNEKHKSIVVLPARPLDEIVERIDVAAASYRLYLQGVIKEEENLIRMIQKNRLKKSKKSAEPEPATA
jgi:predicted RNA binding protein YcfA (HicA-like mRNA interferase family)